MFIYIYIYVIYCFSYTICKKNVIITNELRLFAINIKNLSNKYTLIYKDKINKMYIVELKC